MTFSPKLLTKLACQTMGAICDIEPGGLPVVVRGVRLGNTSRPPLATLCFHCSSSTEGHPSLNSGFSRLSYRKPRFVYSSYFLSL